MFNLLKSCIVLHSLPSCLHFSIFIKSIILFHPSLWLQFSEEVLIQYQKDYKEFSFSGEGAMFSYRKAKQIISFDEWHT